MTKRNPKLEGTNIVDCIPQAGKCPHNCTECFFNRKGAFYTEVPSIPTPEEVGDGIVRMNTGNDSNNQRDLVIETAKQYKRFFFNTSVPNYDFPGPFVLTANPKEEELAVMPIWHNQHWYSPANNLMFVRLRVSATNLLHVDRAVTAWTEAQVPVVLTYMAYYTERPAVPLDVAAAVSGPCYEWKVRHINSYWCPTKNFMRWVMDRYRNNRLVSMCSSLNSAYCRDCLNCQTYYIQTVKRLKGE